MIAKTKVDNIRNILIVEDDPGLLKQMRWCFHDYNIFEANNREDAVALANLHRPSVVTLDLGLPPDPTNATEGIMALSEILSASPYSKVIVVTGNGERENALKAISLGAYDYYQKPLEPDVLNLIVDRAFKLSDLEEENRQLQALSHKSKLPGIIAASKKMTKVCEMVEKIGPTELTTLLLGASGTGKELLARALHNLSPRKDGPFIAINCAAIPENLLESELFGYEKGAFTGAAKQTQGKIEYAHEGTLFLDEIGDLPISLQAKILRFLQERVIERVGGRKEIEVDVRIICATHQDLEEKIKINEYREDLFYRISEITIRIPSLEERSDDAVLLARYFLDVFGSEAGKICRLSDDAVTAIENYKWPGNIRELENRMKRALIMSEDGVISETDLELPKGVGKNLDLRTIRNNAEKQAVEEALDMCDGKLTRTAEILGVSRPTLYDLIEKYQLKNQST